MTTTVADKAKNILKRDNDGNWYSMPSGMVDTFIMINEALQNSVMFSAEWNEAADDLNDTFGDYLKVD